MTEYLFAHLNDLEDYYTSAEVDALLASLASSLDELTDVTITAAATGDYLRYNGTAWVDVAVSQLVSDLDSSFLTPAEGNAAYQPLDSDLTSIAALTTTAYGRSLLTLADDDALAAEISEFYQPLDSDLTSWAGVTRASGFDTFAATPSLSNFGSLLTDEAAGLITFMTTPSSENLRALLTDESGSGVAYFQGGDAGTPSALVLTNATGLTTSGVAAATLVTAADTIASNDNDTTWPTTAAIIDYAQPLDADLTAIAALSTTAAGRSSLTFADPGEDRLLMWDEDTNLVATGTLANIATLGSPATGDFFLMISDGDVLTKVDWADVGTGSGIAEVAEDTSPTLGGDLGGGTDFDVGTAADPIGDLNFANHLLPTTDAASDIGTSTIGINDIHFGSGGVINFDDGDVTLTHAANLLTIGGGDLLVANGFGVVIGHTGQVTTFGGFDGGTLTPELQVLGTGSGDSSIGIGVWDNSANTNPQLNFFKSRNTTIGSSTIVQADDLLGTVRWSADDGVDQATAAGIAAAVDGTPGSNDMPGRLLLQTSGDASTTPATRWIIDSSGHLKTGSNVKVKYPLYSGTVSAAASLTFDVDPATIGNYAGFEIHLYEWQPATDAVNLWMRYGDSGGIDSGASDYAWQTIFIAQADTAIGDTQDTADSELSVNGASLGNASGEALDGIIHVGPNYADTTPDARNKMLTYSIGNQTDSAFTFGFGSGQRLAHIDLTDIQLLYSSGNIAAGFYEVFGISVA